MRLKRLLMVVLAAVFLVTQTMSVLSAAAETNAADPAGADEFWDTYSDTWALTDELGREAPGYEQAGGVRGEKKVGIFYLVWHDKLMEIASGVDPEAPRNISKIIAENPESWVYDASLWGPESSMHYWGEPLYGYYNLRYDDWVVRQHAIQLCDAGVDFIIIDATNFYAEGVYNESADDIETIKNICKVYAQMRSEGQKTPQITFLTTWNSMYNAMSATYFYEQLYTNPEWEELWFRYDGKPLMLGSPDHMPEEIRDYFTYRMVQPELSEASGGSWNWLAKYPQEIGYNGDNVKECMAVGVAQNWSEELRFMSSVDEYGRFISRGRSWTSDNHKLLTDPISEEYGSKYGYNLQEQFDRALNLDPDILFVTAWNEWIAGRFTEVPDWAGGGSLPNRANFGDDFTTEFSREIEMTREGGLNDNFYNQLAENIRWFKGVRNAPDYGQEKSIAVDGDFSDWDDVASYYRDSLYDDAQRDAKGVANLHYTNDTGRNDFKQFKVCRDNENLYFYAETVEDISQAESKNWMTLFISTGQSAGWIGYDYVLNRSGIGSDTTTLERSADGWNWQKVCEVGYKVSGNRMELSVPLAQLGLTAENCSFQFKWMDNMQTDGDALEFYLSGDAAPNARFSYVYEETENVEEAFTYQNMFDLTWEKSSIVLNEGDTAAVRFSSDYEFKGIDVAAYNLFNHGADYTLSLYEWKSSYETSVAGGALITRNAENSYNNTPLYIGAKKIPAGEYLLVISGVKCEDAENLCGLVYFEGKEGEQIYYNGQEAEGMFLTRIYYTTPRASDEFTLSTDTGTITEGAWTSDAFSESVSEQVLTVDIGKVKDIAGIALVPVIENGVASCFPKNFAFYASEDGVQYTRIMNQGYINYSSTAAKQTFDFNSNVSARYIQIRVSGGTEQSAAVKLAGVEVREFVQGAAEGTGNTALYVVIGVLSAVGIGAGIAIAVVIRRKKI